MKTTKTVNSCDCDSVNQELVDKVKKKFPDDESKLEKVAEEAIQQMMDKKYDTALEMTDTKEIIHIGIAFCGKQIRISYR